MRACIDADILRYEIGFAAETGWQTEGEIPPWYYVENLFDRRIENILAETGATTYTLFLSGKNNFRNDIAKKKVYKGTRKENKPYHYKNLTAYIIGSKPHIITDGYEADDAMAIAQTEQEEYNKSQSINESLGDRAFRTIICSRDKDLRQVPGWHFGWELGNQPSFGPLIVDKIGWLRLNKDKKPPKLTGCGLKLFYTQMLMGDVTDNIPGLPKFGPVAAFNLLGDLTTEEQLLDAVVGKYREVYGEAWEGELLEQGRLVWMVRRLNSDGSPVMWNIGDTE